MNKFFKFSILAGFGVLLSMTSCTSGKKATVQPLTITTPSGVKIEWKQQGSGPKAEAGNLVSVHYTGRLTNDSVFDDSKKRGRPIRFTLGKGQVIPGWDEALTYLRKGDIARITIPPQMAYGDRDLGIIPPNSTLIFDVELVEVTPVSKPEPFQVAGLDTTTYESGLKMIVVKKGQGLTATAGDKVSVHYSGYFTDGRMFDSSVERAMPLVFRAGIGQVIKGWDEALLKLPAGSKARLIIPPHLAYGENEVGPIPANSTLIFDIEILEVEPHKP